MSADDLARFIAERLDEHEQSARAATPGPWAWTGEQCYADSECGDDHRHDWGHMGPDLDGPGEEDWVITSTGHDADQVIVGRPDAEHIARHDPTYVLAFVAAGRAILELHHRYAEDIPETRHQDACVGCGLNGSGGYWVPNINDCPTLRAFGAIWAGHPAWREEWRA